jgi:hypothetical protein
LQRVTPLDSAKGGAAPASPVRAALISIPQAKFRKKEATSSSIKSLCQFCTGFQFCSGFQFSSGFLFFLVSSFVLISSFVLVSRSILVSGFQDLFWLLVSSLVLVSGFQFFLVSSNHDQECFWWVKGISVF